MMGIGQVVTLRLPASRLREVNRILENTAWSSYRTEFYPTYDYKAIGGGGAQQGAIVLARLIVFPIDLVLRSDGRRDLPVEQLCHVLKEVRVFRFVARGGSNYETSTTSGGSLAL